MNVFLVSSEAAPFAKVGGLADVTGSLPAALREAGVDARVIMPGYGFIEHFRYNISRLFSFEFAHKDGISDVHVYTCVHQGVPFYFVQCWPYFGEESSVYTDWSWDVPRFLFFNQLAIAVAWELQERLNWFPDVFHVNDWHTALIPFLLAESRWKQEWARTASVITIHNIGYQGANIGGFTWMAGIPGRNHPLLHRYGLSDNLLGIGTAYADMITTVSPRYATEIQYPYAGYELAGLIRERADDLRGILNGLDLDLWNPATDRHIVSNFDADSVTAKRINNKRHLQSYTRLPIRDEVPLVGMVTRLTPQKGLYIAIPALRRLMREEDMQFVVLGTGHDDIEHEVWRLAHDFHWKARAYLQYDANLAKAIYAGSDIFLMPSHFEPCGIGQMIAMRYGSLPVVRETGGLADTVTNYDNNAASSGTGFVFQWEEPEAVLGTLRWALATYREKKDAWHRMQRRAMQQDLSWTQSAQAYIDVYERAMSKHRG